MFSLVILFATLTQTFAACPNACNGHGMCNANSACVCFRNWLGADCSERSCYFGQAFIDTPQGDLNADGRTDASNGASYQVVLGRGESFFCPQGTGNCVSKIRGLNEHPAGATFDLIRTGDSRGDYARFLIEESVTQQYEIGVRDEYGLAEMCHKKDPSLTHAITFQVTTAAFGDGSVEYTREPIRKNLRILHLLNGLDTSNNAANCKAGDPVFVLRKQAPESDMESGALFYTTNNAHPPITKHMCQNMKPVAYFIASAPGDVQNDPNDWDNLVEWIEGESTTASNDPSVARYKFANGDAFHCGCDFPEGTTKIPISGYNGGDVADTYGSLFPADAEPKKRMSASSSGTGTNMGAEYVLADAEIEEAVEAINMYDMKVCSITPTVYKVQWSNAAQWEAYPSDHASGVSLSNSQASTWDEGHFYRECSNKGVCNRSTGVCECYKGYEGEGCTRTTCPNDCSGHGVCRRAADINSKYTAWDAHKTQRCICDGGYSGPDCSLRLCPRGDDPVTRIDDVNAIQTFGHFTPSQGAENGYYDLVDGLKWTEGIGLTNETPVNQLWFSLEFTDELGEKYTTKSIDWLGPNLAGAVEDALESLPNNVIQDVEVSEFKSKYNTSTGDRHTVSVTFLSNSGPIPDLGARYNWYYRPACTELNTKCTETRIARNKPNGAFGDAGFRLIKHSSATHDTSGTGIYEHLVSDYKFDRASFFGAWVVGTKENVMCSNRGLCDYTTGICSCFAGFTKADCSLQNALAAA